MNVEKLQEVISDSGLRPAYIANQIGLKYSTFHSKMYGKTRWYVDEVYNLCKVLKITKKQREAIFFS